MSNTPGYNIRLTITFKTDKKGNRRATYWSMAAMRNLPIKLALAEMFLTNGQADVCPSRVEA